MDYLKEGLESLMRSDQDRASVLEGRTKEITEKLLAYINEIELFNNAYGLVKVKDRDELIIRHILDSLSPLGIMIRDGLGRGGGRACDVGSGAGLPGIPLAIALPDLGMTLLERMGRRAGFLRNTQAVLGLKNVTIDERDLAVAAGAAGPGGYDMVTFRAFRPLEGPILEDLKGLLGEGGFLAAYKGRREAILAEIAAYPALNCRICPSPVPFLPEERHLVIIR